MWVDHPQNQITTINELPDDTPIYHLFDGLIAFTQVSSKNAWINDLFQF